MVLSLHLDDRSVRHITSIHDTARPSKHSDSSHCMTAFHFSDTDDSDSEADSDSISLPNFHHDYESNSDDDNAFDDNCSKRSSLTISTALSPSHSSSTFSSPHAAIYFSPTTFFGSSSFASLLSTRVASLPQSSPTACSSSWSPSSTMPSYSPHSSCVQPRQFAWQLEEAAVLFWERKNALTTAEAQMTHSTTTSKDGVSDGEVVRSSARFIHHTRNQTV